MTTTEQKPRRSFPGVIQSIVDKTGAAGPYFTITFNPRPGLKYPDSFHGRDMALKEGFKAGDNVVLTLQQGKPKKENPQYESEWWWDVVGIERAEAAPAPEIIAPAKPPAETQRVALGEREATIMAAHLENIRADCYLAASIISAARALLGKTRH